MPKPGGYIYAMKTDEVPYVKIGSTGGSPHKRLKVLQTGQPYVSTDYLLGRCEGMTHA